jgi:hypothetical protein
VAARVGRAGQLYWLIDTPAARGVRRRAGARNCTNQKALRRRFAEVQGRYSPPRIAEVISKVGTGDPDPDHISTSFVERQNLTMRMQMRRFTRLTNAFSKKLPHLKAAVALHFAYYNFCRVHSSLRVTPAMEAGLLTTFGACKNY